MDGPSLAVGQNLKLDVTRILDVLFDIDGRVGKCVFGFGTGRMIAFDKGRVVVGHAHAASAAAARGLYDDRVADMAGDLEGVLLVLNGAIAAGHNWDPGFAHGFTGGDLIAHRTDGRTGRADELDVAVLANLGKVRILGQEPVTGVNSLNIAHLGSADDAVDLEVAFLAGRIADANRL